MNKTLKYGISAAVAVFVGLGASAWAKELTIVSWGGAYTKSQVKAYYEPYTAKTGTKINSEDYSGGLAQVKAQVESKNVKWDIVDLEISDAVRGCDEGLFETIDHSMLPKAPDGTPAAKDFIEGALGDCAVATIVWANIFAYDKTKFTNGPKTMADFFNIKDFPGKRGMRRAAKINLEFALMADGVAAGDVYKVLGTAEGVDRAFKKLDSIKAHVVWWTAGAQPPQLLADGEVVMTTAYNGRIFDAAITEGKPFEIVWDGQIQDMDLWGIPKGSKNKEEALKFIAFSTGTQRLADQAKYISYGPARKSSIPLIGKYQDGKTEMASHMPTAPQNMKVAIMNDFAFWADHQDELTERFTAWLAK